MRHKNVKVSHSDRWAVSGGACHNVGAGGVLKDGAPNYVLMSDKRFRQNLKRTDRAMGNREGLYV